jgi:hypothetical protein
MIDQMPHSITARAVVQATDKAEYRSAIGWSALSRTEEFNIDCIWNPGDGIPPASPARKMVSIRLRQDNDSGTFLSQFLLVACHKHRFNPVDCPFKRGYLAPIGSVAPPIAVNYHPDSSTVLIWRNIRGGSGVNCNNYMDSVAHKNLSYFSLQSS